MAEGSRLILVSPSARGPVPILKWKKVRASTARETSHPCEFDAAPVRPTTMELFQSYAFGPYLLIPGRQLLLRDDAPVRLGGRAIDLLSALVERPGEVVTKSDLLARAWPNAVVVEANLKVNMLALRRALQDDVDGNRYIATVTGRGYRFVAPVERGSDAQAVLPTPGAARDNNLPTVITSIFGRAEAIDALRREMADARLVTVSGAGGVGKTTVALAVAEACLAEFEHGVWLVDLAMSRDQALTPNAIAAAVGLTNHSSDVLESLCDFLRHRKLLLLLDNCEHVVESAAACVSRLLFEADGVRILATSREPLLVKGERVRRLPALELPPADQVISAAESMKFPSIQLFVERATEKLETFELTDAEAPLVGDICRRLDGVALAIELAATRIDAFGVQGLLAQLDDRFRILKGLRSVNERQRTLMATLDWSYELLGECEAKLLRAVSVFAGLFDVEGALAVSGVRADDAIAAVGQLTAKSLLAVDIDSDVAGGSVGYRLLESTRAYGLEQLQQDAVEEQCVRVRHAELVCDVLARAQGDRAQMSALAWGARYGRVLDDLRIALAWARRSSQSRTLAIRLTVAGMPLWEHFSLTHESRIHFDAAIGDLDEAGLTGTAFEMKLCLGLGASSMYTQGLQLEAVKAMQRALQIATSLRDTDFQLRCLMSISAYQMLSGELRAGKRSLDEFARIAVAEDPEILVASEIHHGVGELMLGELASAVRRFEAVRQRDIRQASASSLRYVLDPYALAGGILCQAQWLLGEPDTALRSAQACLEAGRASGHHLTINNALSITCAAFYWAGQYDACESNVCQLEEHFSRHRIITRRPTASFYRAALALSRQGSSPDVVAALRSAIDDFRRTNHLVRMPYYMSVLASALTQIGLLDEAGSTIRQAVGIAHQQEEGWCLAEVLRVQAVVLAAGGQMPEAERVLSQAMTEARNVGTRSWLLRAATDVARMRAARGDSSGGLDLLRAVYDSFGEGFATRDLQIAAMQIASLEATAGAAR